jgi:hypothetical protein
MAVLREWQEEYGWDSPCVVLTHPGSGKSKYATKLVNVAWEQGGKKGLYLMLTHDAIKERLGKLREDGKEGVWAYWRGHTKGCKRKRRSDQGFFGVGACTCELGDRTAERPTIAPIDLALPQRPESGELMEPSAADFDFWVIDEIDYRRLLDQKRASMNDMETVAQTHPDEPIKSLAQRLALLMEYVSKSGQLILDGPRLYYLLDRLLKHQGTSLALLLTDLALWQLQPRIRPWRALRDSPISYNFPPVLVPVLVEEAGRYVNQDSFHPRIHIVRDSAGKARLSVWWRKSFDWAYDASSGEVKGYMAPPMFILDATAKPSLLNYSFPQSEEDTHQSDPGKWPDNVYVHQWADDLVPKRTLGISFSDSSHEQDDVVGDATALQRWFGRIHDAVEGHDRRWSVGVITHKAVIDKLTKAVRQWGFRHVRPLYYYNLRGSNDLKDCRILIVLGCPIPNLGGFKEECQAYLWDSTSALQFDWLHRESGLQLRDGGEYRVVVGGYWKGQVGDYYGQKCEAELYQAVHRVRPFEPKPHDRHIFIFTNMPVLGVVVDELLRDPKKEGLEAREARAKAILVEILGARGVCTVPELARRLAAEKGTNAHTLARWIDRNSQTLADATGSVYHPGSGRRPGRFATRAGIL